MSAWRKLLLVACGVAVGALILPTGVATAAKEIQDVFVTNTSANPVPTTAQGTTNVAGTVQVADNRQPFETRVNLSADNGVFTDINSFTVPSGKRLVVEFVSVHITMPPDQTPSIFLNSLNGATGWSVPLQHQGTRVTSVGTFDDWEAAVDALEFADPGESYTATLNRSPSTGPAVPPPGRANAAVYVSGYLLPA